MSGSSGKANGSSKSSGGSKGKSSVSRHDAKIVRRGWLVKEGGSVRSWKRRFFVLTSDAQLSYAKKEVFDGKDTVAPLVGSKAQKVFIDRLDLARSGAINADSKKKKEHCFDIVMPGRVYGFSCDSLAEKDSWVEALIQCKEAALSAAAGFKTAKKSGGKSGKAGSRSDAIAAEDALRTSFAIGSKEGGMFPCLSPILLPRRSRD
jgi:PH domain